jgi:hypothetical protein
MRYDREVGRAVNTLAAAVLAVAVGALPLLRQRCADDCSTHPAASASTPACHHDQSASARVGRVPLPCDHNHDARAIIAIKTVSADLSSPGTHPYFVIPSAPSISIAALVRLHVDAQLASSTPFVTQSPPLRV